jgi:hypothetical protein
MLKIEEILNSSDVKTSSKYLKSLEGEKKMWRFSKPSTRPENQMYCKSNSSAVVI